ncbi:class I SAM-dependent methyltransferase [Myxococcota bacterium]|nr:class I SAM-dependent methyltransferase [Myxococcota bacterium]
MLDARVLDAWRVLNGAGDGAPPGLTLDRYDRWLVLAARASVAPTTVERWAAAAKDVLPSDGLVVKTLSHVVRESTSRVVAGVLPAEPIRVREDDATFLCDLDDGISTGLFLDHHDTRPHIRPFARDVEVLNLFAYTCAFSVHAALGGAKRVTSVDVSKRALRRGRENMEASGLDPDRHRWFGDDVFEHLARLVRKAPSYGLVVADPPVFGRAHGKTFSLERELAPLVDGCLAATVPGGVVVLSTHAVALTEALLVGLVRERAAVLRRPVEVVELLGLPEWDHPAPPQGLAPELDRGDYLKTLVLRVG